MFTATKLNFMHFTVPLTGNNFCTTTVIRRHTESMLGDTEQSQHSVLPRRDRGADPSLGRGTPPATTESFDSRSNAMRSTTDRKR